MTLLSLDNIPALQDEVRALAAERGAVILAHNYQLPEIQQVADYVGDSLGLSQRAARVRRRRDRVLRRALHGRDGLDPVPGEDRAAARPRRRLLAGRLDHRAAAARLEGQAPRRGRRHVRQHLGRGEGGDRLLRDLVQRRRGRRAHLPRARRGHRDPVRAGHVPRRVRREAHRPRRCACGTASATSTPGSGRATSPTMRAAHPGADFLIHPECGCSTSVMEYVAAGDVDPEGVHMLSTGGMLEYAQTAPAGRDGDRRDRGRDAARPADGRAGRRLHRRQRGGELPLHEDDHAAEAARRPARRASRWSRCAPAIAERARTAIERMVAIG